VIEAIREADAQVGDSLPCSASGFEQLSRVKVSEVFGQVT
jgi:hypothetical protein